MWLLKLMVIKNNNTVVITAFRQQRNVIYFLIHSTIDNRMFPVINKKTEIKFVPILFYLWEREPTLLYKKIE